MTGISTCVSRGTCPRSGNGGNPGQPDLAEIRNGCRPIRDCRGPGHDRVSGQALTFIAMTIVPDEKDWTWVLRRPCPECGLDTSSFARAGIPAMIVANAAAWREPLAAADATRRPQARQVVTARVRLPCARRPEAVRLPAQPDADRGRPALPELGPGRDRDRGPLRHPGPRHGRPTSSSAAAEAITGPLRLASAKRSGTAQGRRSDGAAFTVETFTRYLVHDPVHHLYDVTGQRPA